MIHDLVLMSHYEKRDQQLHIQICNLNSRPVFCMFFFFHGGTPKIIFFVSCGVPTYETIYRPQDKEAVSSARILFRYCRSPDKNSLDISMDVWNLFALLQKVYVFISWFFCATLFGKDRPRFYDITAPQKFTVLVFGAVKTTNLTSSLMFWLNRQ